MNSASEHCSIRPTTPYLWKTSGTKFSKFNEQACALLGYSRGELLKMKVSDLQALEIRAQVGGWCAVSLSDMEMRRRIPLIYIGVAGKSWSK